MARKTTSLKIDEELWKKVKVHCIMEGIEISEFIEKAAKGALK
ncbi:ribbon-helix-helix protein, CopG family [Methanococcoides sp. SA1]|nr:ribbon-helix-helix protein, CopG family [Methanococcoides sp. SA1]